MKLPIIAGRPLSRANWTWLPVASYSAIQTAINFSETKWAAKLPNPQPISSTVRTCYRKEKRHRTMLYCLNQKTEKEKTCYICCFKCAPNNLTLRKYKILFNKCQPLKLNAVLKKQQVRKKYKKEKDLHQLEEIQSHFPTLSFPQFGENILWRHQSSIHPQSGKQFDSLQATST